MAIRFSCHDSEFSSGSGNLLKKLLFFQQGSRYDYDRWSELGNSGWSYDEVLPFFLKSEDQQDPKYTHNKKYHSTGGPLPVSTPR